MPSPFPPAPAADAAAPRASRGLRNVRDFGPCRRRAARASPGAREEGRRGPARHATPALVAALIALVACGPSDAGTWRTTRLLDGPAATSSPPDAPQVVMNAHGHALLAWNVAGVIRHADLAPGGGWSATRTVPGSGKGANFFGIALGRSEAAAVAWTTVATRYVPSKLVASLRPANGGFGPSIEIAPGATAPWIIKGAIGCDGAVTFVWMDNAAVWTSRLAGTGASSAIACDGQPGAGAWSPARRLSTGTDSVALLDLAANDDGVLLATWQAGAPGQPSSIVATRRASDGAWEAPQAVSAATGLATWNPKPGLDAAGNAAIGYLNGYAMTVVRRAAAGAWSAPETLSGVHAVYYPGLSMSADGALLAAWQQNDTGYAASIWQASTASASGAWSAPRRLSSLVEDAAWPSTALAGAAGPAAVGWVDDASNTARVAIAASGPAGAWKVTSMAGGWWGGTVPVGAATGAAVAGWDSPYGGNPNAVVVYGRGWR